MKSFKAIFSLVITMFILPTVFAAGPPVQHQFRGGDPASASHVNENFQELSDRIQQNQDLLKTYDYRNYIEPDYITSKTFSIAVVPDSPPPLCEAQETRTYSRTPQGNDTLITVNHTRNDGTGGQICVNYSYYYLATENNFVMQEMKSFFPADANSLEYQEIYHAGVPLLTDSMREGATWGTITPRTFSDYRIDPPEENMAGRNQVYTYTLLAVENVTVPYDDGRGDNNPTTYSNCLKVSRDRYDGSSYVTMEWFCPEIGSVKRMSSSYTYLLTGIN
jgi:hypothetical protein